MRDVSKRDHIRAGLQVKIVPEDGGRVLDGVVLEVLSGDDDRGVLVRLAGGAVGRVLRVWEGGDARRDAPADPASRSPGLPSWNVERPPPPEHRLLLREASEVAEKGLPEALGPERGADMGYRIARHEHGLAQSALRRFAIDDDDLAKKLRDELGGAAAEDALGRALAGGPEEDEARDDVDDRRREEDDG